MSPRCGPGWLCQAIAVLALAGLGAACGEPAPQPGHLLDRAAQKMVALQGFHFRLDVQSDGTPPVEKAEGDVRPPDLHASVDLRQAQVLLEIELILAGDGIYLKSFTGGWQRLTPDQVAAFFDVRALFDPQTGLFAALRDTAAPQLGGQESVDSHTTYRVSGRLDGHRVHQLLPLALDRGDYEAAYWIENSSASLFRAQVKGNLFEPTHAATLTFTFSRLDQPVSITPPPTG